MNQPFYGLTPFLLPPGRQFLRNFMPFSQSRCANGTGLKNIQGSQIQQQVLTVAVPESQAEIVLSSTFQRMLVAYEEFYETEVEVIPVQGWMR